MKWFLELVDLVALVDSNGESRSRTAPTPHGSAAHGVGEMTTSLESSLEKLAQTRADQPVNLEAVWNQKSRSRVC